MKNLAHVGAYALLIAISATSQLASADHWDRDNDPAIMVSGYNALLSALPEASQLPDAKMPWDEVYWPTIKGGIAFRWNSPDPQILKFKPPTLAQLRYMSEDQVAQLSPAEKYDIYMRDYTYPTVRDQFSRKGLFTGSWSGICDGWSASSLDFPAEPGQVVLTNADGIRIPFGSSDIKGLLSFNYAIREFRPAARVGTECTRWKTPGSSYCKDVNAGAFHIVITNKIGLRHEGFVAEIDPGHEVWNQPIYKYSYTVLQTGLRPRHDSARGTVSESYVKMEMTYPQDDETDDHVKTVSHMYPTKGTPDYRVSTSEYFYYLELDAAGNVIGGEWAANQHGVVDHPDFLWAQNAVGFHGYYSAIGDVYQASLQSH